MHYYVTDNRAACVPLSEIPTVGYAEFYEDLAERLADERCHIGHYFALPDGDVLRAYCLVLDDAEHRVLVASYAIGYYDTPLLPSLTARHAQAHPFEREITERYGIRFADMPWDKPLRFACDRCDRRSTIDNYPFYTIEGASLHEVNVGPIHAGIIEPGAFRFICNGEQVLHLEIALGYQHRGVERTMTADGNVLLVNIHIAAGDTPHTVFFPSAEEASYPNRYAEVLYDCSSPMPEVFNEAIREAKGPGVLPPFRGMSFNASAEELITMLNIGSISVKTE